MVLPITLPVMLGFEQFVPAILAHEVGARALAFARETDDLAFVQRVHARAAFGMLLTRRESVEKVTSGREFARREELLAKTRHGLPESVAKIRHGLPETRAGGSRPTRRRVAEQDRVAVVHDFH